MDTFGLTLACRRYDRTSPVLTGEVGLPGVELRPIEMTNTAAMFNGVFTGEFDAGEMSLAELVYYTSRGQNEFLAIPVFPYRMFRHGYIFTSRTAALAVGEDLSGRRVAFPRVVLTAGVWTRGLLVEEYGVSPTDTSWFYGSLHHWDVPGEQVTPRDGATLRWIPTEGMEPAVAVEGALLAGDVDALCTTRIPAETAPGGRVKRLFEDFPDVEAAYFKKTGIYPIMHVLALRKSVIEAHPDLPRNLFQTFVDAKALSTRRIREDASVSLVWKDHYVEREREVFDGDPWAYGLEKNRHVLARFLSYCYDQGVSTREMQPEELFVPDTCGLSE